MYANFESQFPDVTFAKVNEDFEDIFTKAGVNAIPTCQTNNNNHSNGAKVGEYNGTDIDEVEALITELSNLLPTEP